MKSIIDFDIIEQMADINNLYRNIFNIGINDRLDKNKKDMMIVLIWWRKN